MKYFFQCILVTFIGLFLISSTFSWAQLASAQSDRAAIVHINNSEIGKNKKIHLGLDKVVAFNLPVDLQDVLVSDPSKADVIVHSSRVIYLFGKSVGDANVILIGHSGKQILNINVSIERDIGGLESTLRRFISDSNIRVEMMSDNIVLHGIVRTVQDSQRAVELAHMFISDHQPIGRSDGKSKIVNLLNIEGDDQVTLKVTIAEVRRDVLKQIGFNHVLNNGSHGHKNGIDTFSFGLTDGGNSVFSMGAFLNQFSLQSVLKALEKAKAMRTLAEPTLTAISGKSASFTSGGERLYSNTNSTGSTSMIPHKYGVLLHFTPTVLSAGRIGLRIQTEVSEPVSGVAGEAPEYRVRQADTTVELPSGGTIVLAGLLKDDIQQSSAGTPYLSKIPIVGSLFSSQMTERQETEIFISATPYLVKPVAAKELARPDDNYEVESDPKSFLLNRVNKIYGPKEAEKDSKQTYKGAIGFIYK
ncbi:MAG: type II and III secretion system protein family protein [Candidatus Liberibacter ctenarytainae]|uniref:Type II and III secretion system protein family protein n=1 Tax=Candidatus Liberibacter ctenarytainae TaxID=2020335 RepID=A0A937APP5_9HYPH|nr:type II and III secretion system protein family protein [Candidatus Liberibacter ctenarytainae]